jgi:hypothetical protein
MFSPPKISWTISGIKCICLHILSVFYLIQPFIKQIICFDFRKQNSVLPIVFCVPCSLYTTIWHTMLSIIVRNSQQTCLCLSTSQFLGNYKTAYTSVSQTRCAATHKCVASFLHCVSPNCFEERSSKLSWRS